MLSTLFPNIGPSDAGLADALEAAHYRAALQNHNASSAVAVATYAASGDLGKAIAAATLAQGGLHAPIRQARELLRADSPRYRAQSLLNMGRRVPGFGNSVYKQDIDPAFADVYPLLPDRARFEIENVQGLLPKLHPNAAIITAAACIALGVPLGAEAAVFVYCRVPAWTKLCLAQKVPAL